MSLRISAIALIICSAFTACNQETKCETGTPDPNCICTMEYDPVCGCDGITYGNACSAACADIADYTNGACN